MKDSHPEQSETRISRCLLRAIVVIFCCVSLNILNAGEPCTKLVLLGTGTPNADPACSGPSLAIVINTQSYIVDFGPGIVRRAAAASQKHELAPLKPPNLRTAFCTHLHSDHTLGFADLILTPWVLDRTAPLKVLGPSGIREMARHLLAAYKQDIRIRLKGLEPANTTGCHVLAEVISAGCVYQDSLIRVIAFPVHHGGWKEAWGFRFETAAGVIVVSGDRSPRIPIASHCRNCDILVHEVYSIRGFASRPAQWQTYHADAHTSTLELARLASQIRPELLVLTHQLLWGASEDECLSEIRTEYDGDVLYGRDLHLIEMRSGQKPIISLQ